MQRQKKNKPDELYFFITPYKRMTWMPSKSLKHYKKNIEKVKVKEYNQNINLVCITQELWWNWFNIFCV